VWLRVIMNTKTPSLGVSSCRMGIMRHVRNWMRCDKLFRCILGCFILNEKDDACRYPDIGALQSEKERKVVKWMVKFQF
jgi:hypothetical protein